MPFSEGCSSGHHYTTSLLPPTPFHLPSPASSPLSLPDLVPCVQPHHIMDTQMPGFSYFPSTEPNPLCVVFPPRLSKHRMHSRSASGWSQTSTQFEVILHHGRFMEPPAQIQQSVLVSLPIVVPRKRSSSRNGVKKDWSMRTVFEHENVDEDIATFAPSPSDDTSSDSVSRRRDASEEAHSPGHDHRPQAHAVMEKLRRLGHSLLHKK
ncbi:hypothetical protein BDN72DRAFT_285743 [Pluteus cervinus]|uniref:Uncharacterized protein n=1 Tax=Pluteus cervinus TaxID=181527 RepID=A0ACD3AFA8_9AGAR|nr:hypothetical protein BDN72DRAFT_285743 [Pluteus cervinus]